MQTESLQRGGKEWKLILILLLCLDPDLQKGKQGIQKEKSVVCHLTRYCNNTGVRIEKRKTLKVQIMKLPLQLKGLKAQM